MARTPRKSLVARAGAAARKVVSRTPGAAEAKPAAASSATKAPASKSPAKKASAKKASATKASAKKASTTKAPAKKASTTKAPAKKASTTKAPAKKSTQKTTQKTTQKKTATPAGKAPVKKTAAAKAPQAASKQEPKQAPAPKAAKKTAKKASPGSLAVLAQESPWTSKELSAVRAQLEQDVTRLTGELAAAEEDLAGMIENSSDGAGNDQADVGSASFERDQEIVVVNNAREMLVQSQRALQRIDEGTYGQCESCGNPIGKNRLMAFPRATLCLACKQREERR